MATAARTIGIILLAFDEPLADRQLEALIPTARPSTVRHARHRLELAGLVRPAGRTDDGRAKRWRLTNRPTRQLFLRLPHA